MIAKQIMLQQKEPVSLISTACAATVNPQLADFQGFSLFFNYPIFLLWFIDTAYVAPANPPSLVKPLDGNCTYFNPAINVTGVCQCAINNPLVAEDYKFICKNDCQCNHGAANGTCDFNAKQCYCSYPVSTEKYNKLVINALAIKINLYVQTGFVWTNGSDGRNATCQFQGGYNSSQEIRNLLDPIRSLLTTLGLGG